MRTWTLAVSVSAHACALGAVVVAPLFATADLPDPRRPVIYEAVIPIAVPTVSPPPTTKTASSPAVTQSFPIAEPDTLPDDTPPSVPDIGPAIVTGVPTALFGPVGDAVTPPPPPVAPTPRSDPAPVRVGGDIRPPTRIAYVAPIYPRLALASRVQGVVILEAVIDERGRVRELRVLRGHPLLDASAMDAVSKWQFTPTLLNGTAVPVVMTVTVTFSLTK